MPLSFYVFTPGYHLLILLLDISWIQKKNLLYIVFEINMVNSLKKNKVLFKYKNLNFKNLNLHVTR